MPTTKCCSATCAARPTRLTLALALTLTLTLALTPTLTLALTLNPSPNPNQVRKLGATAHVLAGDVGDAEAARALCGTGGPRLRGVLHAAGLLRDMMHTRMSAADVTSVFAPKACGAALNPSPNPSPSSSPAPKRP